jgi:hypothetical protein
MKANRIEEEKCQRVLSLLDSFLSGKLPLERNQEVRSHSKTAGAVTPPGGTGCKLGLFCSRPSAVKLSLPN